MNRMEVYQILETSAVIPAVPQEMSEIPEMIRHPYQLEIELLADKIVQCHELNEAFLMNVNYSAMSRGIRPFFPNINTGSIISERPSPAICSPIN